MIPKLPINLADLLCQLTAKAQINATLNAKENVA